MPEEIAVVPEGQSLTLPDQSARKAVRQRWFELSLVLLLAVGGSFINSLFLLIHGPGSISGFQDIRMLTGAVHEIVCLALLGYVLSRRGLGFRNLGLQWSVRQLFTGLGLVIVSLLGYFLFGLGVSLIRHALSIPLAVGPTAKQIFGRPTWITIPFYFVNPIFEELIVRAYAMAEIGELTGSWKIAAVASALIQASYHLYYGWVTATAIFFQFLIFSLYFARARKATPVIVAHAAFDFYGLVRMW